MAMRPLVHSGLAGCCTVLSVFGVVILSVIGYGFSHNWEAFMGSTDDPTDGQAVGSVYIADTAGSRSEHPTTAAPKDVVRRPYTRIICSTFLRKRCAYHRAVRTCF